MKKLAAVLMALLMLVSLFAGCASKNDTSDTKDNAAQSDNTENTDANKGSDGKTFKLGVSILSASDENNSHLIDGIEYAKKELGDNIEVFLVDATWDAAKQLDQVDTFISQGLDAVIIQPMDSNATTAGIELLNNAGIPVIEFSTSTEGGEYVYVGSSDYDSGYLEGQWVAENAPENAEYVYLLCPMGSSAQVGRSKGFEDAIADSGRTDLVKLSEQCGNAARDEGLKIVEDWIQAYGHFDLMVSQNDSMALGGREALNTAGIDDVQIIGIDGNGDAVQLISEGNYSATYLQNAYQQGYYAIMMAYWTLTGDEKANGEDMIIPYVLIDSNNCDEIAAMTVEDYINMEH